MAAQQALMQGEITPPPMPMTDPAQAAGVPMDQASAEAAEMGIDPNVVEQMLSQLSEGYGDIDNAESYEQVMNMMRGDTAPIEERRDELADLVGPEDAAATPESVLTLVQPIMQMAVIDQGIGGLAQEEMNTPVEGNMAGGIMSTVDMGAEEAPVPVNFNQGGAVQYMAPGGVAGTPDPRALQLFQQDKALYNQLLGGDEQQAAYDEQKRMTKAQMLFDIAQGALAFATPGDRQMSPAERLAEVAQPVLGNIGARSGELLKFKQAQDAEERALDLAALQSSQTKLGAEKLAASSLELAKAKLKPGDAKYQRLIGPDGENLGTFNIGTTFGVNALDKAIFDNPKATLYNIGTEPADSSTSDLKIVVSPEGQEQTFDLNTEKGKKGFDIASSKKGAKVYNVSVVPSDPGYKTITLYDPKNPTKPITRAINTKEERAVVNDLINNQGYTDDDKIAAASITEEFKIKQETRDLETVLAEEKRTLETTIAAENRLKDTTIEKEERAVLEAIAREARQEETVLKAEARLLSATIGKEERALVTARLTEGRAELARIREENRALQTQIEQEKRNLETTIAAEDRRDVKDLNQMYFTKFGFTKEDFDTLSDDTKLRLRGLEPEYEFKTVNNGKTIDVVRIDKRDPEGRAVSIYSNDLLLDPDLMKANMPNSEGVMVSTIIDLSTESGKTAMKEINRLNSITPGSASLQKVGTERFVSKAFLVPNSEPGGGASVRMSFDGGQTYIGSDGKPRQLSPDAFELNNTQTYDVYKREKIRSQAKQWLADRDDDIVSGLSFDASVDPNVKSNPNNVKINPTERKQVKDTMRQIRAGTGPYSAIYSGLNAVLGGFMAPEEFSEFFGETEEGRQFVQLLYVVGRSSLAASPRYAVADLETTGQLFPSSRFVQNPASEAKKLRRLVEAVNAKETRIQTALAGSTPLDKSITSLYLTKLNEIARFKELVGPIELMGDGASEKSMSGAQEMILNKVKNRNKVKE